MSLPTSTPIGRLRAAGCKVSTMIGHDPRIGSWLYSVTLPAGIPTGGQSTLGHARTTCYPAGTPKVVTVRASVYRPGERTDKQLARAAGVDTARALDQLADHVENYDRAASASRQHYIDTGIYLTRQDTAPVVTVDVGTSSLWSVESVVKALGGRITHQKPTEGACGYTTLTIQKEA